MWTHAKLKGEFKAYAEKYKGDYLFYFVVNKKRREYSSWQAAKRDGWVKGK